MHTTCPIPNRSLLAAGIALALIGGCNPSGLPKTYPAKGKVVFKAHRQRLRAGKVEFASTADPTLRAFGNVDEDGTSPLVAFNDGHEKPGAAEGEYRVFVELRAAEGDREGGGGRT